MMNMVSLGASFVAGLSTSIGPCAAPRYLALLGTVNAPRMWDRVVAIVTFSGGLATSYAAIALIAGALGVVLAHSHVLFVGLAIAFCTSGLLTIIVREDRVHEDPHVHGSRGFFSGVSSGLVISPCCAPFVAGTGMLAASSGSVITAGLSLMTFLIGHVCPVLIVGSATVAILTRLRGANVPEAIATIGGTCLLALGLYYGLTA